MVKPIPKVPRNHDNSTRSSQQDLSKKTFGNQNTLPRLPVPDLFDTCNKLVEWVEPLVGENELKQAKQVVDEFQRPGGDGEKLQKELIKWSQKNDIENWLEPFWDEMYLRSRLPVAINKNFSIVCQENPPNLSRIERATSLIHSALNFKKLIDNEELVADQERGRPVCMMQFRRLFSSTRIPKKDVDQLRTPISKSNPTSNYEKHIVVFCKGQIFVLDVLTDAGDIRKFEEIGKDLNTILSMVQGFETDYEAIGILTTMNRDEWANARHDLLKIHPNNQIVLDKIERSLFALCLDDTSPESLEDIFRTILHGNGRNRWFDKSFQIIVCQDGKFGLSGEHSGLDGYAIHRLISFIYENSGNMDYEEGAPIKSRPVKLEIHSNRELRKIVEDASREFEEFIHNTKIKIFEFTDFGKNLIKTFQISPDAFVQLALQLAQKKLFGAIGSTYEAASTRRFLNGRTETLRPVSSESAQFVEGMMSTLCDFNTKKNLLREAANKHLARMKDCMAGMGVERHLFGLLNIYKRFGKNLGIDSTPKIFEDKSWNKLRYDTISTTSMPDPRGVVLSGFGPVVDDGFGIVYKIENDSVLFTITSRLHMEELLNRFSGYLSESLIEMAELLS